MILTRDQLDQMQCSTPGCDHTAHDGPLLLHSRCHTGEPTWVEYQDGKLIITCSVCDVLVAEVQVAQLGWNTGVEGLKGLP